VLFDDTYQSIAEPAEGFFKDKGSKFLAYAYPVGNDAQAKSYLSDLHELLCLPPGRG
jgi:putative IMPACT (imprinted ancient) family translation regulator